MELWLNYVDQMLLYAALALSLVSTSFALKSSGCNLYQRARKSN